MKYRAEIDGLRAVAVLPVILFHAGFDLFSGGYIGVDVFFVISGYLITTILLNELEDGSFTFADFYERRARRILPALYTVIIATIGFAWLYLLPSEMKSFGQGVTATVLFVANFFLAAKGDDYFGLGVEKNPLLHMWSLAVEEQYYIVMPPLLLLGWKLGMRKLALLLSALALFSFVLAIQLSRAHPVSSFFLLHTRAWELLIGSMVAFYLKARPMPGSRLVRETFSSTGLICILAAVLFFDSTTPFPSAYTLVPTIGTALVILFATDQTLAGRVLHARVLVFVGLISYSAYLWHQPFFAFGRLTLPEPMPLSTLLALIAMSLAAAYVTWHLVERPFRSRLFLSRDAAFGIAAGVGALLAGFGFIGHFNSGYPWRSELLARLESNYGFSLACNGNYQFIDTCMTSARPDVAVFGDSFAMHLVEGLQDVYPDSGIAQITQDSCPPYHGQYAAAGVGKLTCDEFHTRAIAAITKSASVKYVVISSVFGGMSDDDQVRSFEATIEALGRTGKRVLIVGPPPTVGRDFGRCLVANRPMFQACNFPRGAIPANHWKTIEVLRTLARRYNATFVDLTDAICDPEICHVAVDQTIIYRDWGHLSREGSEYLLRKLHEDAVLPPLP